MASRGQGVTVTYVAWDVNANMPKDGDVFNHTLRWIKDGTASAPTNSPSQVDATNSPGVYKLTLTGTETTCDVGTLSGKSSTANVVIIPLTISFELLPIYAIGTTGSIATIDGTGRVTSDVTAINGSSTSGNNATLSLKSLNIQNSTGTAIIAKSTGSNGRGIDIAGHGTGVGINVLGGSPASGDGSDGIYVQGGLGSMGNYGGDALRAVGGAVNISGNGGDAFSLEAGEGSSYGQGLYINSVNGVAAHFNSDNVTALALTGRYAIEANGFDSGLYFSSSGGDGARFEGAAGSFGINVLGGSNGIGVTRPKKNVALDNFMFPMFNSTTKVPQGGLSVTAQRAIDGGSFSSCSNNVAEISNGAYRINLSADDMNGDKIMFRFTATGADDQLIEILTQD